MANFLTRVLGAYVKESCFSSERVHVALWSGFVVLKNVELKDEAFDFLNLPLRLRRGLIGKAEFKIPWNKLGSEPVVVVLDQLFLLFETETEVEAGGAGGGVGDGLELELQRTWQRRLGRQRRALQVEEQRATVRNPAVCKPVA